jgi:hypothetical protein
MPTKKPPTTSARKPPANAPRKAKQTPDCPIYERVGADQEWSPDRLRPPLDLDALIAASYSRRSA